jgi:carbon-monoxide dehydrogenase medium subunit
MSLWSNYFVAKTIEEAIAALSEKPEESCLVAGGTDLLLDLQQGPHKPVVTLVDVSQIAELSAVEIRGETLFIGAGVPVNVLAQSDLVKEHAQGVTEACRLIGGPQVRNNATLGGNVAHALPAADGMISMVAMNAVAEIASIDGVRQEPILDLFLGPGKSALRPQKDILKGFSISLRKNGQSSAFKRIMKPRGVALPILNMAIWLDREKDIIKNIRIAVGPAGPVPQRATALEQRATGQILNSELFSELGKMVPESFSFRSSAQRSGAAYRYDLCEVLLEDLLKTVWQRSEEKEKL